MCVLQCAWAHAHKCVCVCVCVCVRVFWVCNLQTREYYSVHQERATCTSEKSTSVCVCVCVCARARAHGVVMHANSECMCKCFSGQIKQKLVWLLADQLTRSGPVQKSRSSFCIRLITHKLIVQWDDDT